MKVKISELFSQKQILCLLLLFLASMNLYNMHYYFIIIAFMMCILFSVKRIKMDCPFLILIMFSISYLVSEMTPGTTILNIIKQFSYPMCYLIGKNFLKYNDYVSCEHNKRERKIAYVLIVVSIGPFIHYIFNMLKNGSSIYRNTKDIWTGEIISATGQAALAIMATAVFITLIFSNQKKWVKILSCVGLFQIISYNMVLAGRTLIFLAVIVLATAFVFAMKSSSSKKRPLLLWGTVLSVIAISVIYSQNVWGLREWVLGSNFSNRFDVINILDDVRFSIKISYIKNMYRYPFGGGELHKYIGSYAHELYLDVYSDAGLVAYLLIVAFVLIASVNAIKVVKLRSIDNDFKMLIMCLYIAILLEFMIEPIVQGIPWILNLFCFISGLINDVSYNIKN